MTADTDQTAWEIFNFSGMGGPDKRQRLSNEIRYLAILQARHDAALRRSGVIARLLQETPGDDVMFAVGEVPPTEVTEDSGAIGRMVCVYAIPPNSDSVRYTVGYAYGKSIKPTNGVNTVGDVTQVMELVDELRADTGLPNLSPDANYILDQDNSVPAPLDIVTRLGSPQV